MNEIIWNKIEKIEDVPTDRSLLFYANDIIIQGEIQVNNYRPNLEFSPYGLSQHGCGCCADDSDQPTHWAEKPNSPKTTELKCQIRSL